MTVAFKCDGPDCSEVGTFPFCGWLTVESESAVERFGDETEFHICSWKCLLELAIAKADPFAELETRGGEAA